MIKRDLEEIILQHIGKQKVILLFGARQVGKTTLLENMAYLQKSKTPNIKNQTTKAESCFYTRFLFHPKPGKHCQVI